jgi:hypothetical protein
VSELIYDRQSVGQSVLVSGARLGSVTNFSFATKFLFRHLRFCKFVAPSLTRGRVCKLLYNCFWALPEQSLLGRSPAELTAFFYCLIRDFTNLEGQVPVFRSHFSAVRNFQFLPLGGLHGKHTVHNTIGFIKPIQHKAPMRVNFSTPLMSHTWGLTSIYMHCFVDKIVENKILSEQKTAYMLPSKCVI